LEFPLQSKNSVNKNQSISEHLHNAKEIILPLGPEKSYEKLIHNKNNWRQIHGIEFGRRTLNNFRNSLSLMRQTPACPDISACF